MKSSKSKAKSAVQVDPLAQAGAQAQISADQLRAIRRWLAEQLVAHEYAKLGEGGHKQTQVPLRQVFVDLPVTTNPNATHIREDRPLFLQRLLASVPLDLRESFRARSETAHSKHGKPEKEEEELEIFAHAGSDGALRFKWSACLLIGGPGQGKSTLGQLACQLHRVALVYPAIDELTEIQRQLAHSFVEGSRTTGEMREVTNLVLPSRPLLPIQVALPDFAAWVAVSSKEASNDGTPSLLSFISSLPSARAFGINPQLLLELMGAMPSLLVLDGFDEVGATQDRLRIVDAARELLIALAEKNSHAQVVATTRPQGYADELSKIGIKFQKIYLSPLLRDEALEYADKLIFAKISGADQRARALRQIHEAAAEPATERLLTTPLQVTIMTALVQQLGRAPRERWNLFQRYFAYTYDREIERNTYASALLAEHRSHIERIHARVALLLQVEAERQGGASARMARERLEEVISEVLTEDEIAKDRRHELIRQIAVAAENRLVFLVEPEPGKFGFEIRSLQEFMAAWALTSGRDSEVEARLQQIAKAPMFRNVALFVASRLFSEGSPLRDILAERICGSLDEDDSDNLASIARSGAMLALETLEEGAALSQPKRARALMGRAVALLTLPPGLEHVRLVRIVSEETESIFTSALETALGSTGPEIQHGTGAAWLCVIDAVNRDTPWAIKIAERYWSASVPTAALFAALSRTHVDLGDWVCRRFEALGAKVNPRIAFESLVELYHERETPPRNWLTWIVAVLGGTGPWRFRNRSGIQYLSHPDRRRLTRDRPDYPHPKGKSWEEWIAIALFESAPDVGTLATALDAIASSGNTSNWSRLEWRVSWPLGCCLGVAAGPEDLRRLAEQVRSGSLGNLNSWISAERGWKGSGAAQPNLAGLASGLPWTPDSIAIGPPFLALPTWRVLELARPRARVDRVIATIREADALFNLTSAGILRHRLAELCLANWRKLSSQAAGMKFDPRSWIGLARGSASMLVPRPKFLSLGDWRAMLGLAESNYDHPWFFTPKLVIAALDELPGNPTLLHLASRLIGLHAEHYLREDELDIASIDTVIRGAGKWDALPAEIRSDIGILMVLVGEFEPAIDREIVAAMVSGADAHPGTWECLLGALRVSNLPQSRIDGFLDFIYAKIGNSHRLSDRTIRQIRDQLQKRTSDLDNQSTWSRLALPLPLPRLPLESRFSGGIPEAPVRIESIELADIGGIGRLSINLKQPLSGLGQWAVLLGPNGSGKTTILRSLVLALRNVKNPAIWPKRVFGLAWQRVQSPLEVGSISPSITVRLGDGVEHRTQFRPGHGLNVSQLPEQSRTNLFPVFAYGCRRGSALGGSAREVNLEDDSGPEVATLFDEGADLIQAETWLVALEGDTTRSVKSKKIYISVIAALRQLLGVEGIIVVDQRLWILEATGSRIPFSSMSDGYLTQAGWFLDLIARWLKIADLEGVEIDERFMSNMRGLVLIDEIDLHLHPQWQIEIISRTRALFPQMSFVVTTHNPLTLVGAQADEIWILERKGEVLSAASGSSSPMLLTGGQLYRQYFGILDIYPESLGRKLQRYSFLSGNAIRTDQEQAELESLQHELRVANADPGWEVTARVIADHSVKKPKSKVRPAPKGAV